MRARRRPYALILVLTLALVGVLTGLVVMASAILPNISGRSAAGPPEAVAASGAVPWGFVLIGGPILLGLALAFGRMRGGRRNREIGDPRTGDDPARGL